MKTLFDLAKRFWLIAVFAVIVAVFGTSNSFGQGKVITHLPNTNPATRVQHGPFDCQSNANPAKAAWQVTDPNCKTAADAFQAAAATVLGWQLNKSQLLKYITLRGNGAYDSTFDSTFNAGMQSADATGYLKELIAADADVRKSVIDAAWMEVYGFNESPSTVHWKKWNGQLLGKQAWFATIVQDESVNLNTTPGLRTGMIGRAYNASFGRDATAAEVTYWTPRTEDYAQLIEKNRCWLYSPSGTQEQFDTVKRSLTAAQHKTPSDDKVNGYKKTYLGLYSVYFEMLAHMSDIKFYNLIHHTLACGP